MAKNKKKQKKIAKKLLHKYRLVILNEDTFEERFAIKLTRLNVFVLMSISAIILICVTSIFIAFTPIREYIPGYSSTKLKKQAVYLNEKTDSLVQVIETNQQYFNSIKKVLTGDVSSKENNKDSLVKATQLEINDLVFERSKQDSLLRDKVSQEEKFNVFENNQSINNFVLFPPVNGSISEAYNIEEKHFAVDIAVANNTAVKATADGTVIFSEWTVETGYVIIIEHSQELISVYKHNAELLKTQGDVVKSGEVIALSGNTGQFSTGPHLHFELWSKGYPLNPSNFIDF